MRGERVVAMRGGIEGYMLAHCTHVLAHCIHVLAHCIHVRCRQLD